MKVLNQKLHSFFLKKANFSQKKLIFPRFFLTTFSSRGIPRQRIPRFLVFSRGSLSILSAFLKLTTKWNICNCPLLLQKEWEFQKRQTNSIQTCFWTMQLHIISLEKTLLTSCVDAFNYFIFKSVMYHKQQSRGMHYPILLRYPKSGQF